MNPEIVSRLLGRVAQKDLLMRSDPKHTITQQFLQIYVQNGINRMLEIFEEEYLTVLKSYNQLETLINFLTKEAAIQTIKPADALVSADLLAKQASEVFMTSTHTNRSNGFFCHFVLFIDEDLKKEAVL